VIEGGGRILKEDLVVLGGEGCSGVGVTDAMRAASPPLEPPLVRSVSCGLRVHPNMGLLQP
jgi:hypothetical protein